MKPEQQIKALAELDGWKAQESISPIDNKTVICLWYSKDTRCVQVLPSYLTSYDAIIPLIQKHINSIDTRESFVLHLSRITGKNFVGIDCYSLALLCCLATPSQLAEALLHATGKWTET